MGVLINHITSKVFHTLHLRNKKVMGMNEMKVANIVTLKECKNTGR